MFFLKTLSLGITKRAAQLVSALFFLLPSSHAEVKSKKAETAKDIIEKAYNLSLQKDRSQATNILVSAIKQENTQGTSTTELKRALQQVTYVFYSDRAQQAYELAVSLLKTDPGQAQQKLTEALRIEPDNLTLYVDLQRAMLLKKDCSGVLENVTKAREQNPYDENLQLLQAQTFACLGRWDAFGKMRDVGDSKKSNLAKYWLNLDIDQALSEKNASKAKDLVSALQKLDPKYPEIAYWQWRLNTSNRQELAQKYSKDCKNISPMTYRQYMTDVNLCRRTSEVESTTNKNSD